MHPNTQVTDMIRNYCRETARRSFTPNFTVHPVGKTIRGSKTIAPFRMVSTSSTTTQVWGRSNIFPQIIWDSYLRPNGLTQSDEIWCDITRDSSVFLAGRHPLVPRRQAQRHKNIGTSHRI